MIDSNPNRTKIHRLRFILSLLSTCVSTIIINNINISGAHIQAHTHTHTLQYTTNTMEKRIYTNRSEHQGKCHQQCYTIRMDYIAMFRHQPVAMTLCTCSCCRMLLYGSHYDVSFVSAFFGERELISRIFGVKVSIAAQSKLYGSIKYKRIQNRIRSCL